MTYEQIKTFLISLKEDEYKEFSAALIPNIDNVLGIRLPILRKFAKEIYKSYDWEHFLKFEKVEFMEENLLQAMIISDLKLPSEKMLEFIKTFIPRINNWSVCDCFCTGLKFAKKNQELIWKFLSAYFKSKNEFEIRFVSVMLLSYFIDEKYIDKTLQVLSKLCAKDYYAQMGIAWAYSVCFVKFFDKTLAFFKSEQIEPWIFNKSIQKACESYRIDKNNKALLKKLKLKES